jgi:hypothetical protein
MTNDISLTDSQPNDLPELPGRLLTIKEAIELLESLKNDTSFLRTRDMYRVRFDLIRMPNYDNQKITDPNTDTSPEE